jgi:hypothetical protein
LRVSHHRPPSNNSFSFFILLPRHCHLDGGILPFPPEGKKRNEKIKKANGYRVKFSFLLFSHWSRSKGTA